MSLPWSRVVELFYTGADLRVAHQPMTLREAVDAFEAMPREAQDASGIALHDPLDVLVDGRPALAGFLNAEAVRRIASEPEAFD